MAFRLEDARTAREEFERLPGVGRSRPRGIPEMLSEMDGFASYFEDLRASDASKLQPHREGVRKITQRFLEIAEGGERA